MDLQAAWNQLSTEKFEQPAPSSESIKSAIGKESVSQISQLKYRVWKKFLWAIGIWTGFTAITFFDLSNPEFLMVMGVIHIYYAFATLFTYRQYRKVKTDISYSDSVRQHLVKQYSIIQSTLHIEEMVGLTFYPISGIIGMCISATLKGDTLAEIFSNPKMLVAMVVFALIFTPIGHYLATRWNKCAFRVLMEKLKKNINELEEIEGK